MKLLQETTKRLLVSISRRTSIRNFFVEATRPVSVRAVPPRGARGRAALFTRAFWRGLVERNSFFHTPSGETHRHARKLSCPKKGRPGESHKAPSGPGLCGRCSPPFQRACMSTISPFTSSIGTFALAAAVVPSFFACLLHAASLNYY